jgi:hypothetical protein
MGRGDRRNSRKMRRRKSQRKFKIRQAKKNKAPEGAKKK